MGGGEHKGRTVRLEFWRPSDVVGFAAHWTWIWCVFWSSLFYGGARPTAEGVSFLAPGGSSSLIEPLWAVSIAANVAVIAALHLLSRRRSPLGRVRGLPWAAAILTAVGTLLLCRVLLDLAPGASSALYLAGSVLTGIGSGTVVVLWGELLASVGSRETVGISVASLLLAAGAYVVISLVPLNLAQLLVCVLPIVSVLLYRRACAGMPHPPRGARGVRVRERPPYRMIVIALFFGVSFGVMKGLMAPMGPEQIVLRDALNIVAIVVGVLALHLSTRVLRMDFNHLTYQVALPLMAAGFLFLPLHGTAAVVGTAVHQCGYQYFYIVLWSTWPILAQLGRVPAGWIVTWGMLAIQFGQLVGSFAAAFAAPLLGGDLELAMFSAVAIFAMLLVALFVFGNQTPETGWGFVKPAEAGGALSESDGAAALLARRFRLSPREAEVFFLLARGRNRAYIAQELSIGDETVKSHVKSLYRKTGVHSQQELIDLVEGQAGG